MEDVDCVVDRGDLLVMSWELPIDVAPGSAVSLGVQGENLTFEDGVEVVASFSATQTGGLRYRHNGESWEIFVYETTSDFLPDGVTAYSFEIYDLAGDLLVSDEGTVTVNG